MANGDSLFGSGTASGSGGPDMPAMTPPDETSPAPSGPPTGGGPVLSALARRSMGPPVSAPGPGNMAQGMMMLKNAVSMIEQALPSLGAGSPQHKDAVDALRRLSRHLPQGQSVGGLEQTQLGDLLRNSIRNALLSRLMQQQSSGGGQQGGPGPSQPGLPTAPPASLPLPGA